jgi:uncharacterized protein YehS (DUF1456 family)
MSNNDIIRSIRYTFDLKDEEMIQLFSLGGKVVSRAEVSDWMKRDDDPAFMSLYDKDLSHFLNGLIVQKRGKKDDQDPVAEKSLNNNMILRKLKIALNLQDEDILKILDKADLQISKHELSAFFRKPTQSQFRPCKDQVMRNFLRGLQLTFRGD